MKVPLIQGLEQPRISISHLPFQLFSLDKLHSSERTAVQQLQPYNSYQGRVERGLSPLAQAWKRSGKYFYWLALGHMTTHGPIITVFWRKGSFWPQGDGRSGSVHSSPHLWWEGRERSKKEDKWEAMFFRLPFLLPSLFWGQFSGSYLPWQFKWARFPKLPRAPMSLEPVLLNPHTTQLTT